MEGKIIGGGQLRGQFSTSSDMGGGHSSAAPGYGQEDTVKENVFVMNEKDMHSLLTFYNHLTTKVLYLVKIAITKKYLLCVYFLAPLQWQKKIML